MGGFSRRSPSLGKGKLKVGSVDLTLGAADGAQRAAAKYLVFRSGRGYDPTDATI